MPRAYGWVVNVYLTGFLLCQKIQNSAREKRLIYHWVFRPTQLVEFAKMAKLSPVFPQTPFGITCIPWRTAAGSRCTAIPNLGVVLVCSSSVCFGADWLNAVINIGTSADKPL